MNTGTDEDPLPDVSKFEENQEEESVSFQIRPCLANKFKCEKVKEVIREVLNEKLKGKTYDVAAAGQWSEEIAVMIKDRVKELNYTRYKLMVQVVLGEQRGAGVVTATRCLWDADSDSYSSEIFTNDTIFCMAVVYGVFFY
ncbi:unnamed protein product [Bemisia tabaci]|uniref:Tctex1 domain-containing protein 2 n=1 Tax=Bemisia tabaci TaxID=7038 RepID=A0A9P0ABR9_BEMTA|nr:PREDICTED: tctex1 domain-containing protein 2-like [Bemisia tabaci]XP_018903895.1 PREDICTED: tctex1 domain-containing protein 2-like [Bemisia tabaci]CAH0389788.1 unnamed protein product [Bemisia tabaci]